MRLLRISAHERGNFEALLVLKLVCVGYSQM